MDGLCYFFDTGMFFSRQDNVISQNKIQSNIICPLKKDWGFECSHSYFFWRNVHSKCLHVVNLREIEESKKARELLQNLK